MICGFQNCQENLIVSSHQVMLICYSSHRKLIPCEQLYTSKFGVLSETNLPLKRHEPPEHTPHEIDHLNSPKNIEFVMKTIPSAPLILLDPDGFTGECAKYLKMN